jgi:hypothetical protein
MLYLTVTEVCREASSGVEIVGDALQVEAGATLVAFVSDDRSRREDNAIVYEDAVVQSAVFDR